MSEYEYGVLWIALSCHQPAILIQPIFGVKFPVLKQVNCGLDALIHVDTNIKIKKDV